MVVEDKKKLKEKEKKNNKEANKVEENNKKEVKNKEENSKMKVNTKEKEENKKKTNERVNNNIEDVKDVTNNKKIFFEDLKMLDKKNFLFFLLIITILFCIYIVVPRINLIGAKEITLNYDEEYVELGYRGEHLFRDIKKEITISSDIVENKLGDYQIKYSYNFLFFTFNKYRKVNIVDKKEPEILVDSDTIKICPNESVSNIEYSAIDEYDGDITDSVVVKEFDNILKLSVFDKSNNLKEMEININRIDDSNPEISLSGSSVMYINKGSIYYEPGYSASDNCDGDITDNVTVTGNVDSNIIGEHTITYSVTDSSNNTSEVQRKVIVRNPYLYNDGTANSGTIYLTFDDGPNADTTSYILDVLKEEGVKATFFVTCSGPDYLIKRMYDEGHTVALHTATHDYAYVYSSVDNYFSDLQRVSDRVKNITGEESKIIRFPGGSSNTISRNFKYGIMSELTLLVLDRGYRYYDWNIDSNDAGSAYTSSQVYYNVINNLYYNRSNMVLMHDIKYTTKYAIKDIITYGKNNGYKFDKITMDTYMIRHDVNN